MPGRKTENDYDALNRIVSTSYSVEGDPSRSDSTPPVSYFYDGSTSLNRRGRLRSVTDGAGTSRFEYDSMGRISHSVRTTRGKTLTADYAYTLLGGVRTATYQGISAPSFSLNYGYDSQGRQTSLSDGFNTYVSSYSFEYQAQGATERTFYGNGTQERIDYNDRLQPVGRSVLNPSSQLLMDLDYSFTDPATLGNNGNVYAIDDLLSGQGRSFSYGKLNRLSKVAGTGWSISYNYDRFGNRLSAVGASSPPNFQDSSLTIDPSTNRIASAGWEYDSAGNVIEDGGSHHLRWDAAGRLIELGPPQPNSPDPPGDDGRCTGPGCPPPPPPPPDPDPPLDNGRSSGGFKSQSAETVSYEYDYQGRRVVKDEGSSGRIYFWDEVLGEVIWEFPLENPASQDLLRFFLNGRLVAENDARPGGGFHYFHRDHLGTSKLLTDFFSPTVVCDEVYHPFGQLQSEQPSSCNAHVRKFTGKERDPESGLDYFGARYCDSVAGRFISVDPVMDSIELDDPQSWNRYSYVGNNPLAFVDPDGKAKIPIGRQLQLQLQATEEFIDSIPFLPESFKSAIKFLFVPDTPEGAAMQSLPFPSIAPLAGVTGGASKGLGRLVDNVVESALRPSRAGSGTSRALQALQKKLDRGDEAFRGLEKSLDTALQLIDDILKAKDKIVKISRNRNGVEVVDVFDPSTGRGVRLINESGKFDTFVNLVRPE